MRTSCGRPWARSSPAPSAAAHMSVPTRAIGPRPSPRAGRARVPQMKARRWGRIVHIASVMAFIAKEGRNGYCATKAALVGMTRANALDLGPHGITVNAIAPGPFLTDLPGALLSDADKKV